MKLILNAFYKIFNINFITTNTGNIMMTLKYKGDKNPNKPFDRYMANDFQGGDPHLPRAISNYMDEDFKSLSNGKIIGGSVDSPRGCVSDGHIDSPARSNSVSHGYSSLGSSLKASSGSSSKIFSGGPSKASLESSLASGGSGRPSFGSSFLVLDGYPKHSMADHDTSFSGESTTSSIDLAE